MLRKFATLLLFVPFMAFAQYGTFSKEVITEFQNLPLSVVLDNGQTEYNDYIQMVMKDFWTMNKVDFISMSDFKALQYDEDRAFLIKIKKADAKKHEATFLTIVRGWKDKKGQEAVTYANSMKYAPWATEVASIMLDPKKMEQDAEGPKLWLYVKSMVDYINQVNEGKIIDKATADRLYASRTRLLHDMQLVLAANDLDANVRENYGEFYTHAVQVVGDDQVMGAIEGEDRKLAIVDVVFTGEYKTRHCFKTIFNARTGEIMYLKDDQSLHGKKAGLFDEDLKSLERAR